MANSQTRTSRIEARTTPYVLDILRRAASLEGRSLSDFVVSAAERAARDTIEAHSVIHLSPEEQRQLIEALENPAPPTETALQAQRDHDRLIIKK